MSTRVLLVEDNPDHADLFRLILARVDHPSLLITHSSAESAADYIFNCVQNEPLELPNILFVDLKLPGADGFSLVQDLNKIEILRPSPIYMLTSSNLSEDIARASELGIVEFIRKPIAIDKLAKILASH